MNESTAKMRAFAQRLIAHERQRNKSSEPNAPAGFGAAVEKLHRALAPVVGPLGFRSLLSRALALASDEVRWLRACHVKADGSLEYPEAMAQLDQEEVAKGEMFLVAQLLGLLATFVGEPLALRLVQEAWPEAPIDDWNQ